MITQARTARPSIVLNGADYFSKLAPYFLNLSYTDNSDGKKADDLNLQLADRDNRFISDWMPDKGTYIDVSIICERWFSPNGAALSLDCGRFWIDTIDFELPQHTVSIKASSIPTDAHVKASEETRGWENTTLKEIANQIAGENNMSIDWQSEFNPRYNRVEQMAQSGLSFLKERANDCKLAIKVCRQKIIFFDEATYEQKAPAFTLVYGNGAATAGLAVYRMSGGHFSTKLTDTTKKASVAHVSPHTGKLSNESFSAEDSELEDSYDQKVNEDPDSDEEGSDEGAVNLPRRFGPMREGELIGDWDAQGGPASGGSQRKAQAVVREANKEKELANIELSIGNPLIASGQTFTLTGVGQFDGKWFIESATHEVGPMFRTKLSVRRCLEGY